MKIRLNKTIGIIILILSGFNLFIILALAFGGEKIDTLSALLGVAGVGIGILYLRGTYFEITENNLILKALMGSSDKAYPFTSIKDFSIQGKSILLENNDKNEKLPIYAWMADKKDWNVFKQWLSCEEQDQNL